MSRAAKKAVEMAGGRSVQFAVFTLLSERNL
jgi:hypothetical protein